jgi:hypothetical protein
MARMDRRALLALAIVGLVSGLALVAIVLSSDHVDDRGLEAGLGLLVGWSLIGTLGNAIRRCPMTAGKIPSSAIPIVNSRSSSDALARVASRAPVPVEITSVPADPLPAALDGRLELESPAGGGTRLHAAIPL